MPNRWSPLMSERLSILNSWFLLWCILSILSTFFFCFVFVFCFYAVLLPFFVFMLFCCLFLFFMLFCCLFLFCFVLFLFIFHFSLFSSVFFGNFLVSARYHLFALEINMKLFPIISLHHPANKWWEFWNLSGGFFYPHLTPNSQN